MLNQKYSLIIINYNDPILLHHCLTSIQPQRHLLHEVIVVDDGSSPPLNTTNCHISDDVTYIYKHRTSTSCRAAARNLGAQQASGDVFIFLDGDVYANPNLVETYKRIINNTQLHCVLGDSCCTLWPEIMRTQCEHTLPLFDSFMVGDPRVEWLKQIPEPFYNLKTKWTFFWSNNFCITREAWELVDGMNEQYKGWGIEDQDLGYRLLLNNIEYDFINNPICANAEQPKDAQSCLNHILNYQLFYENFKDVVILDFAAFNNQMCIDQHPLWETSQAFGKAYWVFELRTRATLQLLR